MEGARTKLYESKHGSLLNYLQSEGIGMYDVSMSPSAISESLSESMSENMSGNIQKTKQRVLVDNLLRTGPSRDLWPLGNEGVRS